MIDISIGAIGAAIIAGLISLLGLVIGKEQKISEFRQAWIDELRKCFVAYLVNINAVSDLLRMQKSGKTIDDSALVASYKMLNEASHGIRFRINAKEEPAKALLKAMNEFELAASENSGFIPDRIRPIEQGFIDASKELLKFEWMRVKRGEMIFVWTKRFALTSTIFLVVFMAIIISSKSAGHKTLDMRDWNIFKV